MLKIIQISLLLAIFCQFSACGVKGKLKTPAQIEKEEAKKAAKSEKDQQENMGQENQAPDQQNQEQK